MPHANILGGLVRLGSRSKPRGVRQLFALQVWKKEKMSLSYRARAIDAANRGVPAEDVLLLARPAQYLEVLKSTRDA